jgi:hypothetical protein
MQHESELPTVTEIAAARRRLEESGAVRREAGFVHEYPGRDEDERTVATFKQMFGELPPSGLLRSLAWFIHYRFRGEGVLLE